MSKLFLLGPEVAGGWGPHTVVSNRAELAAGTASFPNVTYLEYRFEGWLGDAILETTPCFIVTFSLADSLRKSDLTGFHFDYVEVSLSEDFENASPVAPLPEFERLLVTGRINLHPNKWFSDWSGDDICLSNAADLVVSERCLQVLQKHNLNYCSVKRLEPKAGV